jgi:hypothetical protein
MNAVSVIMPTWALGLPQLPENRQPFTKYFVRV